MFLLWLDIAQWAGDTAVNKTHKTLAPLEPTVCLEEAGPQKYIISYNKYRKIRGDDKYNEDDAYEVLSRMVGM